MVQYRTDAEVGVTAFVTSAVIKTGEKIIGGAIKAVPIFGAITAVLTELAGILQSLEQSKLNSLNGFELPDLPYKNQAELVVAKDIQQTIKTLNSKPVSPNSYTISSTAKENVKDKLLLILKSDGLKKMALGILVVSVVGIGIIFLLKKFSSVWLKSK